MKNIRTNTFIGLCALSLAIIFGCGKKSSHNNVNRDYGNNTSQRNEVKNQKIEPPIKSAEDDPYYDNSLSTGTSPYSNSISARGDDSQIKVKTSSSGDQDVVVIIKRGGSIAKNAYIQAGSSYTFDVSNGTYQVFFYYGKGWNPNKQMPNGMKGGFVTNESYAKDSPVSLDYQILEYELIPQRNGNFNTQPSNANEVF